MRAVSELSDEEFLIEYKRNRALSKISHETRVGEVDGISFDLRHEDINPEDWTMDILGGDYGWTEPHRRPTLPFIWFPWYGDFDLTKVKHEVLTEFREANERPRRPLPREVFDNISDTEYQAYLKRDMWKDKKLPKSWIRDEIKSRTPDAVAKAGDYLSVDRFEIKVIDGDNFAWLRDRAEVLLFVRLSRANGIQEVLSNPIILHGATKLTYRQGNKPLYAIIERVRRAFGLEKITRAAVQKFNNKYDINANAFAALWRAAKICDRYFPPVSKLHNSRSNVRSRLGSKFLDALDDACMLGYAWANAEADHKMRPSALSALKAKDGAARGGHASGASWSAKAAETWQVTVRAEALRVRSEQTDISQEKLAAEILYKCGEDLLPSHPIIVRYISKLEREGVLPRRKKRR